MCIPDVHHDHNLDYVRTHRVNREGSIRAMFPKLLWSMRVMSKRGLYLRALSHNLCACLSALRSGHESSDSILQYKILCTVKYGSFQASPSKKLKTRPHVPAICFFERTCPGLPTAPARLGSSSSLRYPRSTASNITNLSAPGLTSRISRISSRNPAWRQRTTSPVTWCLRGVHD